MTKYTIKLITLSILCYFFLSVNVTTIYAQFNICSALGFEECNVCNYIPLWPGCSVSRRDCDTDSGRCDSPVRSQPVQTPQPAASPSRGSSAPASPTPVINQPTVCTPGEFKTPPECTGRCQGCFADTGEARIFQCRADGSGFDEKQSECRIECAGFCQPSASSAPQSPQPIPPAGSPSRSNPTEVGGNPSSSSAPATPQPIQEVRTVGYHLSENPIPAAVTSPTSRVDSFPATIQFKFTDSNPGTKTVFVRFFYSNGTYRDSQKSIIYRPAVASPSPTSSPNPSTLPSAAITSVSKTYLSDGEDVVVNFTTNGIANLVNLRIDKAESFSTTPPSIQVKPSGLTKGSIVWPATHIAHTLGFHEITLHPYYCPSLNAQGETANCVAGPISNAVFVEMIGTIPVSDSAPYGNCAAFDRYRYKAGKKTNIYCPGAWKQEAEYSSRCSADNENPYYYEYCREGK